MLNAKLQEVFRRVFDDNGLTITDEMSAEDIDAWDSLNHIQLIVAVEKDFEVKFKNSEIARLANVGDLKALLAKRKPELV